MIPEQATEQAEKAREENQVDRRKVSQPSNAVTVEDDEQVDVSFTSSDVKIIPQLQNGFVTAELYDYAVYFQ